MVETFKIDLLLLRTTKILSQSVTFQPKTKYNSLAFPEMIDVQSFLEKYLKYVLTTEFYRFNRIIPIEGCKSLH
jgi:hypothetical protein